MIRRAFLLLSLPVFVSACAIPLVSPPPLPVCPMGDVYEYLSCAEPHFSWHYVEGEITEDDLRKISGNLVTYCSDDPTEWLPVLDRNVRQSVPESRGIIKDTLEEADGETLNEKGLRLLEKDHKILQREYNALADRKLFSRLLGFYLFLPALNAAHNDNADLQNCADHFEMAASEGVEEMILIDFFGRYKWYLGW